MLTKHRPIWILVIFSDFGTRAVFFFPGLQTAAASTRCEPCTAMSSPRRRGAFPLIAVVLVGALSRGAAATEADTLSPLERTYGQAAAAFNSGDFVSAASLFEQALRMLPAEKEHLRAGIEGVAAKARAHVAHLPPAEPHPLASAPEPPPEPPQTRTSACAAADSACAADGAPPLHDVLEACVDAGEPSGADATVHSEVTLGICAVATSGTNAQLYDWAHALLCAGAARIELLDARTASAVERDTLAWAFEPLLADGKLVLTNATAGDELPDGVPGCAPAPASAPHARWAFAGAGGAGAREDARWLLTRAEEGLCSEDEERARGFWRACTARNADLRWVAHARAPHELLLPAARLAPAGAAGPPRPGTPIGAAIEAHARALCASGLGDVRHGPTSRPHATSVRLPLISLAEYGGARADAARDAAAAAPHAPPRPLLATHVHRAREWGRCAVGGGATCASELETMLVVRPGAWCAGAPRGLSLALDPRAAEPPAAAPASEGGRAAGAVPDAPPPLRALRLVPSAASGEAHDEGGPDADPARDVTDWWGRHHLMACDAHDLHLRAAGGEGAGAGGAEPAGGAPPPQPAWVEDALGRIVHGDGLFVLKDVGSRAQLSELRTAFLRHIPPERHHRRTQGFVNHMCQTVHGVAVSPGNDPRCEPMDARFFALAHEPRVLALARALLGPDCILHNAGVSLVGDGSPASAIGAHQDQPLPTDKTAIWGGRVPPPSHPLALQAIWPLDEFEYENGATFVMPRTHHRPERLDAWLHNATDVVRSGLFPVRFLTGGVGDVGFLLGTAWHGASSHVRARREVGGRPRLALLYEYAPSFVAAQHRYPPQLVARLVPPAQRALFPQLDMPEAVARDEVAAAAAGAGGECADGGLEYVSVWQWPAAMRERPHCARLSTRVVLRGGRVAMPVFGLGTGSPDDEPAVIGAAVRAGYRLIDTGQLYGNEHIVREGVRLSGVHREAIFLASKAGEWCPGWFPTPRETLARAVCIGGYERTREAVRASLAKLGTEYVDLYLLHWPMGLDARREPPEDDERSPLRLDDPAHRDARLGAWRALVELQREGALRAIGVSNWSERQMEEARAHTGVLPAVLQMEMHPLLQRPQLRAFCERNGILVQVPCAARPPERPRAPHHRARRARHSRAHSAWLDTRTTRAPRHRRRTATTTSACASCRCSSSSPRRARTSPRSRLSRSASSQCAGRCTRPPPSCRARASRRTSRRTSTCSGPASASCSAPRRWSRSWRSMPTRACTALTTSSSPTPSCDWSHR